MRRRSAVLRKMSTAPMIPSSWSRIGVAVPLAENSVPLART